MERTKKIEEISKISKDDLKYITGSEEIETDWMDEDELYNILSDHSLLETQKHTEKEQNELATKNTFSFLNNIRDMEERPEPKFLIKGIERGMVAFLAGNGGAGKGYWLLHLLFSSIGMTAGKRFNSQEKFATGDNNFLLLEKDYEKGEKQPKMGYFSFEDNYDQFSRRAWDCMQEYRVDAGNGNDFCFFDMSKSGGIFKTNEEQEFLIIAEMKEKIEKNKIDLMIIDTLSVINQKYQENDNQQMSALLEDLKKLAYETNTGILIVHHTNKTAINANSDTNEGSMRGASSLIGNARFVLMLEKCKINDPLNKNKKIYCNNYVEVRTDKTNFTKPEKRIYKRLENGVLIEMPEGFEVVDDLLNGSKNKVKYD